MKTALPLLFLAWLACAPCAAAPPAPSSVPAPAAGRAFEPVGPVPGPQRHEPSPNPLRGDAQARMDGRRLFLHFNCAGCHGGHAGGGMGPSLRDPVWIYGGAEADIFDSIAEGRANGMPAWGALLPDAQIWQLVSYIASLETAEEADPPK